MMCALYTVIIQQGDNEVVLEIAGHFTGIFWVIKQLLQDADWDSFEITKRGEKEAEEQ